MLPKAQRLTRNKEFDFVFKGGKSHYSDFFGLKIKKNQLHLNRFGFIVSIKVSKKAVLRNRLKRQVRSVIREENKTLKQGFDCVFIFFPLILDKKFNEIRELIKTSFKKLNMYN